MRIEDTSANLDLIREMTQPMLQQPREGHYPGQSTISFLPVIDLEPTDMTWVYSTLSLCGHARHYSVTPILQHLMSPFGGRKWSSSQMNILVNVNNIWRIPVARGPWFHCYIQTTFQFLSTLMELQFSAALRRGNCGHCTLLSMNYPPE